MARAYDMTTLSAGEALGKTVKRIVEVDSYLIIEFTDGTLLVIAGDDGGAYVTHSDQPLHSISPYSLACAGIIPNAELDEIKREHQAKAEAQDRAAYERLRARFDPEKKG